MFDAVHPEMQRTEGAVSVGLVADVGTTRLVRLRQEGSAKAFLPRTDAADPEVVFLNTAGGLTGGDRYRIGLDLGPGARATATTQTAERIYRTAGGEATVDVRLSVGRGASLDWLPQETILFDAAALRRETAVALAAGARCLMAEILVFGRAAMGETVGRIALRDCRRVTREGRPVFVEPLSLEAAALASGDAAGHRGARALATVALFDQGAEDAVGPVRALLAGGGVRAEASGWDGKLVVRAMAPDAAPLRRLVAQLACHLRQAAMPRVWQV